MIGWWNDGWLIFIKYKKKILFINNFINKYENYLFLWDSGTYWKKSLSIRMNEDILVEDQINNLLLIISFK